MYAVCYAHDNRPPLLLNTAEEVLEVHDKNEHLVYTLTRSVQPVFEPDLLRARDEELQAAYEKALSKLTGSEIAVLKRHWKVSV